MEPSVSVPTAAAARLAAVPAALPELEPHAVRSREIRIACEAADGAHAADRSASHEVRPFAQVRFAEHDGPRRSQRRDHRRVAPGEVVREGQRAGGGGDGIEGFDVVLDEERDAVERTAWARGTPLVVEPRRVVAGSGIEGEHGVKAAVPLVDVVDAFQIRVDELHRGDRACLEGGAEIGDGFLHHLRSACHSAARAARAADSGVATSARRARGAGCRRPVGACVVAAARDDEAESEHAASCRPWGPRAGILR
jgi:hypothetical protein